MRMHSGMRFCLEVFFMSDFLRMENNKLLRKHIPKINRLNKKQFDSLNLVDDMIWPDYEGNLCIVKKNKWVKMKEIGHE